MHLTCGFCRWIFFQIIWNMPDFQVYQTKHIWWFLCNLNPIDKFMQSILMNGFPPIMHSPLTKVSGAARGDSYSSWHPSARLCHSEWALKSIWSNLSVGMMMLWMAMFHLYDNTGPLMMTMLLEWYSFGMRNLSVVADMELAALYYGDLNDLVKVTFLQYYGSL